ncbi:hypothetical protein, partial [Pseudanabaena cinerea]|uniref:hypothetical protein n=1 Tax=Pseudanabaena cinerea TaxID=2661616 RepID=UPI001A7E77DE
FIIFFFAYWDDDNRYQTLVMLQLIELMALVFTNGLKCRNKCEVASIPFFYFPTSLLLDRAFLSVFCLVPFVGFQHGLCFGGWRSGYSVRIFS